MKGGYQRRAWRGVKPRRVSGCEELRGSVESCELVESVRGGGRCQDVTGGR